MLKISHFFAVNALTKAVVTFINIVSVRYSDSRKRMNSDILNIIEEELL